MRHFHRRPQAAVMFDHIARLDSIAVEFHRFTSSRKTGADLKWQAPIDCIYWPAGPVSECFAYFCCIVQHPARKTPFIIVPGQHPHQARIHYMRLGKIGNSAVRIMIEIN